MVSTQKKIRDLSRILKKLQGLEGGNGIDAQGNHEKLAEIEEIKRKIAALELTKEQNKQKEVKRKHENKYHMVKFFERRKVVRQIRKIIHQLKSKDISPEMETRLKQKQEALEEDLTYIM